MAYGQPYRPYPEEPDDGMGLGTALGIGGLAAGAAALTPWGGRALRAGGEGLRSALANNRGTRFGNAMNTVGDAAGRAGAGIDDFGQAVRSGAFNAGKAFSQAGVGAKNAAVEGGETLGAKAKAGYTSLRDSIKGFGAGIAEPVRADMGASLIRNVEAKTISGAKMTNPEKALNSLKTITDEKGVPVLGHLSKIEDTEAAHLLAKKFIKAKNAKVGSEAFDDALAAAKTYGGRLKLSEAQVEQAFNAFKADDAKTAFTTGQKVAMGAGALGGVAAGYQALSD